MSYTEENYLKEIYAILETQETASTTMIAEKMNTSAASVSDMIKRLADKGYLKYQKYKGVTLSMSGEKTATDLIRNHRLWETFLVEVLELGWEEVHDIAEELEHVRSERLIKALIKFLGNPQYDPHGDPIPDSEGKFAKREQKLLFKIEPGTKAKILGVRNDKKEFLHLVDSLKLSLGTDIEVIKKYDYDDTMLIKRDNEFIHVSSSITHNIYVQSESA